MEHLKTFSSIIYIKTPLDIIIKRIDIGQERGLAVPAGMSIPDVYSEREPLYQKYYDFILDGSKTIKQLVDEVKNIFEEPGRNNAGDDEDPFEKSDADAMLEYIGGQT